jgi:hypothetical protein
MADHSFDGDDPMADAFANAEEVEDVLTDLVERTRQDRGAPFRPDVLEALRTLRATDRAAFETLRDALKCVGCRVGELDKALGKDGDGREERASQVDTLLEIAGRATLFHSPDGKGYADITIEGHRETWLVRSSGFRRWLTQAYFMATGGAPGSEAITAGLNAIEARAHFEGPEAEVFLRVGDMEGRLYIDLGNASWRAVEIDIEGWRLVDAPPVRFRRATGLQPLPTPEHGGSIDTLRPFLNVASDAEFVLVVCWALAVLRSRGPYPLLAISGEQGSAKSTFTRLLKRLLDPNSTPLRALPREDRDLFITANNGHLLAFDNVSKLQDWTSDTLCRLATGGGFAVRQLYTDGEETLFDACRPILLNGIGEVVTRPDLAERAVFLHLQAIPAERRRPEGEYWRDFDVALPTILGALLDGLVEGLRRENAVRLPDLPRMADFAVWASACETAWWPEGTFWTAYTGNRAKADDDVIDANPVAAAVRDYMRDRPVWIGTATELLDALKPLVGEDLRKERDWPKTPSQLSEKLTRAQPALRRIQIDIEFVRDGHKRTRLIRIRNLAPPSGGAEPPSAASAASANTRADGPDQASDCRPADGADAADAPSQHSNWAQRRWTARL